MSDYNNFFELLIKQTCRRAAYEFEMGSRQSKEDSSSIYSLEFLKRLYDKPRDNILKVLRTNSQTLNGVGSRITNGFNFLSDNDFTNVEKQIFFEFLHKVKDMEPPKAKQWIELQHYMHYVYRNFATASPDPSPEDLSPYFISEMRNLVLELIEDDESQFYMRMIGLLREYCIFAHWNYSNINENEIPITKLFYYYEAMLSAAKNLSSIFPEFEIILYKNYAVCWIDFNTCIFINFFFESEFVQKKIAEFQESKLNSLDSSEMFSLLNDLRNLWINEQRRICDLNEDALLDVTSELYDMEVTMLNAHKFVLMKNFWINRSQEEKDNFDLSRVDHHIFRLLADRTLQASVPILDRTGQCICEECLVAKYKCFLESEQVNGTTFTQHRLTYCRSCRNLVDLEFFHQHINSHAVSEMNHNKTTLTNGCAPNLSSIVSNKIDLAKLGHVNDALKMIQGSIDIYNSQIDEPFLKASEPPLFDTSSDIPGIMASTKVAFEEFLRQQVPKTTDEIAMSENVPNFIKIKKDIFQNNATIAENNCLADISRCKTNEPKSLMEEAEPNVGDLVKNGNNTTHGSMKQQSVKEHACEHSCKNGAEIKNVAELKKPCHGHGTCDHHKESKKCDCTYCEVFGTSVASHSHKNNELRDRLRIRLHQRREKRTRDNAIKPSLPANTVSSKIKPTVNNKIEERVPPPTILAPVAPPAVKTPDTSSMINDIHGLLNYIEGNTNMDKMAIAEKKAAKKARQRMKKEEERLKIEEEQRRKEEEERRKEEEIKRAEELARQLAEKARIRSTVRQTSRKDSKKKSKNKNSSNSKQTLTKTNSHLLEETIPAMVTIKRVAENGSSPPTVTITLKGSTPDQDKLLYTLVNGADSNNKPVPAESTKRNKNQKQEPCTKNNNKNNKKSKTESQPVNGNGVFTKELKVTLALDPSIRNSEQKKANKKLNDKQKPLISKQETKKEKKNNKEESVAFPMLRLPPGITITKVEGPMTNRNYKTSNLQDQPPGSTINVGKSGVIVVDTEKLIQQTNGNDDTSNPSSSTKSSKRNRKKKNKKLVEVQNTPSASQSNQMITLKNPIFQNLHNTKPEMPERVSDNQCAPAAIFTSENGMVTIRSSRLQQSLTNGMANSVPMAMPNMLSDLKPVPGPEVPSTFSPSYNIPEIKTMSPFNAQEILSGLPGIEITKVDKRANKFDTDMNKSCQTAQVSIIPATNGEKFCLDKDDWTYDSVFTPKDILEDDMDADERELEAFKRFCQQSVPPKRKEKVAHLNVKDIVLKKKNDVNCV